MSWLSFLWRKWSRGFVDQTQFQADADVIAEYERVCALYGRRSEEAVLLRRHVDEAIARRAMSGREDALKH